MMMNKSVKCQNPFQQLALMHIQENFLPDGILNLDTIPNGIRMTDKTGAVADFIYNGDTGRIDMQELDSKRLRKEKERQKVVQLIQRDLLK
ncbi:MAG: hypothetical protein ACI4SF_15605 [Oscillospiraceae bacterium]